MALTDPRESRRLPVDVGGGGGGGGKGVAAVEELEVGAVDRTCMVSGSEPASGEVRIELRHHVELTGVGRRPGRNLVYATQRGASSLLVFT